MQRYHDAAVVEDEAGKAVEVLRQATRGGLDNGHHLVYIAEVDTFIRFIKVAGNNNVDPTGGTVQFYRKAPGSSAEALTASQALAGVSPYHAVDVDLSVAADSVKKGESVYALVNNLAPSDTTLFVSVGWMPDLWNPDADPRTF